MRCLIRRITRRSRTGTGHADSVVEADSLTLGRGTDQQVFLPDLHVALQHAVIRAPSRGRFPVQARTPSGVQINGRTVQSGVVRAGDRLTLGRTELRLHRPPRGYDLALQIDEAPSREGRQVDVGALSLRETRLTKRPWAWLLALAILGLGLGVPFATIEDWPLPWQGTGEAMLPVAADIDWRDLGGDQLWESGPMSRQHRFFGRDCGTCHRQPFQRVTDAACLECHAGQPHHADSPAMLQAAGLPGWRCADCHREHTGLEGLIAATPRLCTQCHAEPGTTMPGSDTRAVTGFGGGAHPEFRVRLIMPDGDGGFAWRRVRMDEALAEDNGLLFPHDIHLDPAGIEGPEGSEMLACDSCHRPDSRETAMQPTRFERDCRRCHRLDFEPNEPQRQLPHGEPESVVAMLEEYYARVALAGGYRNAEAEPPEVVRQRRPGGSELGERERRAALAWAQDWAREVAAEVIEVRTCTTCHAVERRPQAPGGWHVEPVALTQEWLPAHHFSHEPHLGEACSDCHAAVDSSDSSDVLMPGIDTCRDCHGDAQSEARVASRCIDCHGFHEADRLTMEGAHGDRSQSAP